MIIKSLQKVIVLGFCSVSLQFVSVKADLSNIEKNWLTQEQQVLRKKAINAIIALLEMISKGDAQTPTMEQVLAQQYEEQPGNRYVGCIKDSKILMYEYDGKNICDIIKEKNRYDICNLLFKAWQGGYSQKFCKGSTSNAQFLVWYAQSPEKDDEVVTEIIKHSNLNAQFLNGLADALYAHTISEDFFITSALLVVKVCSE